MKENRPKRDEGVYRTYLKTLFDFSFTSYITIQMLPVLYSMLILASVIGVAQLVIDAFNSSNQRGWIYLALSPFALIVVISAWRSVLEFLVVVFRIAEDIETLAGMRESVDKISDMTDFSSLTSRIPFVRLLHNNRQRRNDLNDDERSGRE